MTPQTLDRRLTERGYKPVSDPGIMLVRSERQLQVFDEIDGLMVLGKIPVGPDTKVYNARGEGQYVYVTFTPYEWIRRLSSFTYPKPIRRIGGNPQIWDYSKQQGDEFWFVTVAETYEDVDPFDLSFKSNLIVRRTRLIPRIRPDGQHILREESIEGMFNKEGNSKGLIMKTFR